MFTIILLFLAFFICRAVPIGQPINIDLYQNNTIISFDISDPSQIAYTVPEEQHKAINNNWENQDGWIPADNWNILDTQPQLHTSQWIDWVCDHMSIYQIREITGCLFAQNFHTQFEEVNGYPFHADTPHLSIPEIEESPVEGEQQDQH